MRHDDSCRPIISMRWKIPIRRSTSNDSLSSRGFLKCQLFDDRLAIAERRSQEADEDGSGELDLDEFIERIGPHLGDDLTKTQLTQLFMKIDADAGGTVDWDEFTNFMFLQRRDTHEDDSENWRFFTQDFGVRNDVGCHHRAPIAHLLHVEQTEKYLTSGRDGSVRVWNAENLKHVKTVMCQSVSLPLAHRFPQITVHPKAWVTASVYMPLSRRIAISSSDGAISFCGMVRGSYDLLGKVYMAERLGSPQCLCLVEASDEEYVAAGDDNGCVSLLLAEPEKASRRYANGYSSEEAFEMLHAHDDWVTQVLSTVREVPFSLADGERGRCDMFTTSAWCPRRWMQRSGSTTSHVDVLCTATHTTNAAFMPLSGVRPIRSSPVQASSAISFCGSPRRMRRKLGSLLVRPEAHLCRDRVLCATGHTSSVTHLALDTESNNIITLSLDRTAKVWDLRNHKCIQTIAPEDWPKHVQQQASCMIYDRVRRRLVMCSNRLVVWPHKLTSQDRSGHPCVGPSAEGSLTCRFCG